MVGKNNRGKMNYTRKLQMRAIYICIECLKIIINYWYYDLDSVLSKIHTLVLSNTRELDRELHTEMSTLYTKCLCYYFSSLP